VLRKQFLLSWKVVRKQFVLTWKALRKQMRLNWKQVGTIVVVRLWKNAVETLGDRIFMASCIHSEVVFLTKVFENSAAIWNVYGYHGNTNHTPYSSPVVHNVPLVYFPVRFPQCCYGDTSIHLILVCRDCWVFSTSVWAASLRKNEHNTSSV